jgi:hypothetical protein
MAIMGDAAYYREEARGCRALAAGSADSDAARRWCGLAADYEQLADALENCPDAARPPVQRVPMWQQPIQQQQKKAKGET